jgi:phosphatidylglycerophosphate synthase
LAYRREVVGDMTAGERWAHEALLDLRRAGYRPDAWRRFVNKSLARAAQTRVQRPALAGRARRWCAAGFVAAALAPRVLRQNGLREPGAGSMVGWWLSVAVMLDWHLGMAETADGEQRNLSPADALTLLRLWLTPLMAATPPQRRWGLSLLAGGVASDLVDGRLAARAGPTRLGRDLDTAADIAFFTAAVAAARRAGWLPGPAAAVALARHAATVGTTAAHYFLRAGPPPAGRYRRTRWTTPLSMAGLAATYAGRRRTGSVLVVAGALAAGGASLRTRAHSGSPRAAGEVNETTTTRIARRSRS